MEIANNAVNPGNGGNKRRSENQENQLQLPASNAVKDSAAIEELSIICGFAILLQ